jgi:hypothetical protein
MSDDERSFYDIMMLSADQLRVLRVLMRLMDATFLELMNVFQSLPPDQRLTSSELMTLLEDLRMAAWVTVNRDRSGEKHYRINLGYALGRIPHDSVLDQLIDRPDQRYQKPLETLTSEIPRAAAQESVPVPRSRSEALNDLMARRGGKRTIPKNIWDKLDTDGEKPAENATNSDSAEDNSARRSSGKDLLSLF